MTGVTLAAAAAVVNFLFAAAVNALALNRPLTKEIVVVSASMGARLTGLAAFFILLVNWGYSPAETLTAFVVTYNFLLGFEILLIMRARTG